MLQNADDAYVKYKKDQKQEDNKGVEVLIEYKNNILRVCNSGTTFSYSGILAVVQGNNSDKSSDKKDDYIGNKGTGFRSLLNWAKKIRIFSGEWSIEFSEERAKEIFNNIKNEPQIQKQIKKKPNLYVPILSVPQNIKKRDNNEYDTVIEIEVDNNRLNDNFGVIQQTEQLDFRSLLFLPNITSINISTDGNSYKYFKPKNSNKTNGFDIITITDENKNRSEEYYYFEKEIQNFIKEEDIEKSLKMAIAIPKDFTEIENNNLYCFFPLLNTTSSFNVLFHATCELTDQRNDLTKSTLNTRIIKQQLVFLVEVAKKFAKPEFGTKAIEILTPSNFKLNNWKFDRAFGNFGLEEFYLNLLSEAKILPTVNNNFISIKDNPKLFTTEFPDAFKGEQFNDLLQLLKTEANNNLIKIVANLNNINLNYSDNELYNIINRLSENLNIEERVIIFLWLCEENYGSEILPNLLQDTRNEWVTQRKNVYLPTDTGFSILPIVLKWADLCILHQDYVTAIIKQIKNKNIEKWDKLKSHDTDGEKRILDRYSKSYLKIEFTEQSSLDLMLSEINNQIKTYENSKSFIEWFYSNYKNRNLGQEVKSIPFILPIRDNEIYDAKHVFVGEEYGNELGEALFVNSDYKALYLYSNKDDDNNDFLKFMENFGVVRYPKVYKYTVTNTDFKNFVCNKYPSTQNNNYLETYIIDSFEKMLQNTESCLILQWILQDNIFYNYITGYEKGSNYKQQWNWTGIPFPSNEWLIYLLRRTKWIEINKQKYAPDECLFIDKSQEILKIFYPCIDDNIINELANIANSDTNTVKQIFQIIGVKNKIWELSSNDFYKILLQLPEYDYGGKISKSIYTNINKNKTVFVDSDNKTAFLKNGGKLYAVNRKNETGFIENSNIYFISTVVLNAENKWMLAVNDKTGTFEYYQKYLGIQEYKKENMKITSQILHSNNDSFIKNMESFKVYAFAYRVDMANQDEVNIFKKIKINLCSDIQVENNLDINTYFPIGISRNEWLIKVPNNKDNYELSKAITEIFHNVLKGVNVVYEKFRELFDADEQKREKLIKDNLGHEYIDRAKQVLFGLSEFTQKVREWFGNTDEIENLNFDYINSWEIFDYEILVSGLQLIKKDITDLNKDCNLNIDLSSYYKQEIKQFIIENTELYKQKLYNSLINNATQQEQYLNKVTEFENYQNENIENSVNFNWKEIIYKKFPELLNQIKEDNQYEKIFNSNIKELFQNDCDDYLSNKPALRSQLYFTLNKELKQAIKSEYENWQKEQQNKNTTDANSQVNSSFPKIDTKIITTAIDNSDEIPSKNKHSNKRKSGADYNRENAKRNNAGKYAECIAFSELRKKYDTLIWCSENNTYPEFASHRDNQPLDDIVCDMWYKGKTIDDNLYFEVKSSKNEFFMSIPEYNSFKKYKSNYKVVLADIDAKTISLHSFDELDNKNSTYTYIFKFKQRVREEE